MGVNVLRDLCYNLKMIDIAKYGATWRKMNMKSNTVCYYAVCKSVDASVTHVYLDQEIQQTL